MQNKHKIQFSFSVLMLGFLLASFSVIPQIASSATNTGTLRICNVLAEPSGAALASATASVPHGQSSISLATNKDFSSPVLNATFDAQLFTSNTTIDGVAMKCTDPVSVPFGQYYYNAVSVNGTQNAWAPSKYFDSASTFSLSAASVYTNGLFTADPADDVLNNNASDGLVTLNESTPDRTVTVLNTIANVLDNTGVGADASVNPTHTTLPQPGQCVIGTELLQNGGFETPSVIDSKKWSIISFMNPGIFWKSYDTSYGLELQAGIADWVAHSGLQYAEVDGGANHDLSQDIATLPGSTYSVSFWTSPRPGQPAENNTLKVLVNGSVLAQVNAPASNTVSWTKNSYTFVATSTVTRLSFVDGKDVSTGTSIFIDDVSLTCTSVGDTTNAKPTISLNGSQTIVLTVGDTFVDPGFSASDVPDGDLTSKVVVTGAVDIHTPGTYVLTYTVTDSSGNTATVIRTVIVLPVAQCVAGANMISNGGFENPTVVNPKKWTSIRLSTPNLFWTSFDTVIYPYIEFQAGYTEGTAQWTAHTGTQYAEIDGGTRHDVSQVLATIPGNTYTLSYWMTPRPSQPTTTNTMNVSANGIVIDTVRENGPSTTAWSQRTVTFTATTTVTRISFTQGENIATGEGVFIDDVSVVCSGGSVTNPPANQCMLPDALSDVTTEVIGQSYGAEHTLASMLLSNGITLNTTTDQKQYQSFNLSRATTTIDVTVLGGETSAGDVFGYYVNNDTTTFVPLFAVGTETNTVYPTLTHKNVGETVTVTVGDFDSIQFAVHSTLNGSARLISSVNSVNGADRVLAYDVPNQNNSFVLAFEDLPVDSSDNDYNDLVVKVVTTGCAALPNTAPTITLVGSNPLNLTVGQTFVDPGATAQDKEDGNITNKIVITGTVNINVPGTYTLTYTVTDSGGLSASTTRTVVVSTQPTNPPVNACTLVSDTNTTIVGGGNAVLTYVHPYWTSIPGASWIWSTAKVIDATATTTTVFSKTFTATSTVSSAVLSIASDNSYIVKINGTTVAENSGEFNYSSVATHNVASAIVAGVNTITFEVTNFGRTNETPENNPAGLVYKLELGGNGCGPVVTNTPPTITLVGANPANITTGQTWVEPGATANDLEDGNITNKIVITGTVDINVPGTYTLTYTVTDSGGLSASTTRQVIVSNPGGGGNPQGKITFCIVYTDINNIIATSSANLPFGSFVMKLATTTDIANSTVQTKTWTAQTFNPTQKFVSNGNDADCISYDNLALGTYYYSELGVSGAQWIISSTSPRYNDQFTTPVNNIFDLFAYSPELFTATTTDDASRNVNADGQIVVSSDRREHTVVTAMKYSTAPACMLPEFTSASSASGQVGKAFSFAVSATSTASTTTTYTVATSSLPAGLSFDGNTISGTPTQSGTFTVEITATNSCGITRQTLTITVAPQQTDCPTCGGGTPPTNPPGGGGGNGPIVSSLAITNEKVVEITPGVALVTWNTNLPATKEVGYGTASQPASFIVAPFGYATSTVRVSDPLGTVHSYTIAIESGKTYYFRPVSTDFKTTVAGIELVLNPGTSTGGNGGGSTSCYYLFDYLKQGWNNNPVEVKKLQVFLRDLEGFNVEITGVYDDQTVVALNAFQNRYKDDILTPWGHTAPTSFTYITTKKKVNEIYCKMAFPVTAQQQAEIDAFRAFLLGLQAAGVTVTAPTEGQTNQPIIIDTNEVGSLPQISTSTQGTLAGIGTNSTSTAAGRLTASVIASGKKLGNFAAALFAWPWSWAQAWFGGNDDNQCIDQSIFSHWFNWVLIIVILTMSYLWYRERQENRKAARINEELELLNK